MAELDRLEGDPRRDPVNAVLGRCWAELNGGRFQTARLAARTALTSNAARDDPAVARRAHLESTLACWMLGDHRGLADHAGRASSVDERFAAPALRAQVDFRVGIASIMAGYPVLPQICSGPPWPRPRVSVSLGSASPAPGCLPPHWSLTAIPWRDNASWTPGALARDVEGSRAMLLVDWAAGILAVDGAGSGEPNAKEVVPVSWQHFPPFAVLAVGTLTAGRTREHYGGYTTPSAAATGRTPPPSHTSRQGSPPSWRGRRRPSRS